MAACSLFEEDEVCLVTPDRGYIYGLVLENSEFLSSDEESDDFPGQVKRGTVRVAWHPDGKETVVQENKVILADRSLMPGDVVRRMILNEDSQRGYVKDMSVQCHLRILGTDKYIYNVNSKHLSSISEFDPEPGDVTLDSWIGGIEQVNEELTLRLPDGARCVISDTEVCEFEDILDKRGRHTEFCNTNMYPGRELRGTMQDLAEAKFINSSSLYNEAAVTNKPRMNINATVEAVSTQSVEVHWMCRGFSKIVNPLTKMSPPDKLVTGDDLKRLRMLDCFAHCSVQIGDKAYYTIKDTDTLETVAPKRKFVPTVAANLSMEEVSRCSSDKVLKQDDAKNVDTDSKKAETETGDVEEKMETGDDHVANGEIVENDEDYEDVDDDDSDCGSQASGHSNPRDRRKRQGRKGPHLATKSMKKVKGRRTRQKIKLPERVVNVGDRVAVELCYTYTTAHVVWQDGSTEEIIGSPDLFPIHHLDELEYFPGDYVINAKDPTRGNEYGLVLSCDHKERTCLIQWMKPYEVGKTHKPQEYGEQSEMSVYDIKDHPDYKFRPGHSIIRVGGFEDMEQELHAVGQVFELDRGDGIKVKWADGSLTCCFPQELYIVNDDPSDFGSSEWDSESSDSDTGTEASWETENEEEVEEEDNEGDGENGDKTFFILCAHKKTELDTLLVRAQTALAKLESLCESLDTALPNVSTCYHDILRIYKICKDLDKILKSNFFDEDELTDLISNVRQEIKTEKSRKLAKHLEQMFQSWHQGLSDLCKDEGQGEEEELCPSASEDSRSLPGDIERNICVSNGSSVENTTEEELVKNLQNKCSKKSDEDSNTSNDSGTEVSSALTTETPGEQGQGDSAGTNVDAGDSAGANSAAGDTTGENSAEKKDTLQDAAATQLAKDLCLKICRRLRLLTAKIQVEVNTRWKKCESTQTEPVGAEGSSVDPVSQEDKRLLTAFGDAMNTIHAKDMIDKIVSDTINAMSSDEINAIYSNSTNEGDSCAVKCGEGTKDGDSQTEAMDVEPPKEMLPSPVPMDTGFQLSEEVEKSEAAHSTAPTKGFQIEGEAPACHKFRPQEHVPSEPRSFMTAVRKELKLLRTSLPDGIIVKGFENRMDLYSVMIMGPARTPYEDGLFFFDVQLPNDYPNSPPVFHYHSYCSDRLNPNLYEDGKVCVSLLGTWSGKGNEMWTSNSNLLQVLVSIQGLILVGEPYYNEAGYERQRGTQQGLENSRMYNEMAVLKLLQSLTRMVKYPPDVFQSETRTHLHCYGYRIISRLEGWVNPPTEQDGTSTKADDSQSEKISTIPDFPLIPVSKGFRLSLKSHLEQFRKSLELLQTDKV